MKIQTVFRSGMKFLTTVLSVGALLAGLWSAFCLLEKWRAQRAWNAYLNQSGPVPLSIREVLPAAPRDVDNFAAAPMVKALFERPDAQWFRPLHLRDGKDRPKWPGTPEGNDQKPTPLPDWAAFFHQQNVLPTTSDHPARDVLTALETVRPELDTLEDALERPSTLFPVDWNRGFSAMQPHLSGILEASSLFSLEAAAHLAAGDPGTAAVRLSTALELADRLREEPVLVSTLVRNAGIARGIGVLHEGLALGKWPAAELLRLQKTLAELSESRSRAAWAAALRGERALANQTVTDLLHSPDTQTTLELMGHRLHGKKSSAWAVYPRVWFILGQVRINQTLDTWARNADGIFTGSPPPATWIRAPDPQPAEGLGRLKWLISDLTTPAYSNSITNWIRSLCTGRHAVLATALEQAFQRDGQFPESLDSLPLENMGSPALDPMTHEKMRYQRLSPTSYRLWSVGPNGTDDHGTALPSTDARRQPDWVWTINRQPTH